MLLHNFDCRSEAGSEIENTIHHEENELNSSVNVVKSKENCLSKDSDEESTDLKSSTKKRRIQPCLEDSSDEEAKIRKAIQASNQQTGDDSSSEGRENKSSDDNSIKDSSSPRKKIRKSLSKRNKSSLASSSSSADSSRCSSPVNSINNEERSSRSNSPARSVSKDKGSSSNSNSSRSSSDVELENTSPFKVSKEAGNKSKPKEKKQSRKSKEAAMKEIYSESSRMIRESAVGLPYHRPRQRTLKEFLNRKKALPNILPVQKGIKLR